MSDITTLDTGMVRKPILWQNGTFTFTVFSNVLTMRDSKTQTFSVLCGDISSHFGHIATIKEIQAFVANR